MNDNAFNCELPKFLKEIINTAKGIEGHIPRNGSEKASDNNFFVYHFLHRNIAYGDAIILLTEKQCFHEAVLVARTMLEGLIYFMAYAIGDHSLARRWRLFYIYENYGYELRSKANEIRSKCKNKYKTYMESAQNEFDFDKWMKDLTQHWHKRGSVFDLAKGDENLKRLYYEVYSDFSKIFHWTVSGVSDEREIKIKINAALAVAFQSLYEMSNYVNMEYKIGVDDDLKDILARYSNLSP